MTNYCDCKLTLTSSSSELIDEIILLFERGQKPVGWMSQLKKVFQSKETTPSDGAGLLGFLCPLPLEIKESTNEKLKDWKVENWGCSHEVYDAICSKNTDNELSLTLATDYAPPLAALIYGANRHNYKFELMYCEPGNGLVGKASNSDNFEYFLTLDKPPIEEGIPRELVDEFCLDEMYLEFQGE